MHIRVFIASPSDVSDERGLALQVLGELPYDPLLRRRITVEAVAWDHPVARTAFLAGETAQDSVIRSLGKPSECNIVVVILWSRLGCPIEHEHYRRPGGDGYLTGTEWEYADARQAYEKGGKPAILVYHRRKGPVLELDPNQRESIEVKMNSIQEVRDFLDSCHGEDGSFANPYQEPSEFKTAVEKDLKQVIRELLESENDPPPSAAIDAPLWEGSPFPGLRTLTVRDAPVFHGRDREVDLLMERIKNGSRFIAVIGASGSGKSSLVWAGLIPRLLEDASLRGEAWQWLRFTPGEIPGNPDPFLALSMALKPVLDGIGVNLGEAARLLEDKPSLLEDWLKGSPDRTEGELILFIDQFEELFSLVDGRFRTTFIDFLCKTQVNSRLRVVITLRADFYHLCLGTGMLPLLRMGAFPLAAPDGVALQEMFTRPAARADLSFEPGLEERILRDTVAHPGGLALMAFTLRALYEHRERGALTNSSYVAFGGVQGAIGQHADQTFRQLPEEVRGQLGGVFRELIEVDENGTASRRRVTLDEVAKSEDAEKLLAALIDARLLVTDQTASGTPAVEVAHEALFRSWPRLRDWIDGIADDLRLRREIAKQAVYWEGEGAPDRRRWPDDRVIEVVEMCQRLGLAVGDFSPLENRFVGPIDVAEMRTQIAEKRPGHEERARIGRRLLCLGDYETGTGLGEDGLPDISWCEVPGGEVKLEGGDDVFQVAPFRIARHPITYIQYRSFTDSDDGFNNEAWWAGLPTDRAKKPSRWVNPRNNHPADNLAWDEAIAFCRWLSSKLGYEVCLPTEWQWQQAATGGLPGRVYPWGESWDGSLCNSYESGVAVGLRRGAIPGRGIAGRSARHVGQCLGVVCQSV